ncbi:MAG: hypothetical protein CMP12_03055 [Zunongwangia sp.]|jgi:hypothetical protein|uniref:Rho termination factor N-terminal domain-containing protein n=2 Tax=Zunongwangia profunda TaxID=398743 RepID=D5BJ29_ZUNPS|nr:hypothetical protein [Zunongwangia profunda]MAO34884.1 hypothetical protein [Zunongwangia sp.]ADF53662.1 hypothetical protein ZPR_3346 [Zunongwangia profunda SM-A87]MAS70051.1 hypothetical protein [Zunongwangia sp.]MCC4229003.1 hypothetical protein [Zunongwangia profunda]HCV79442.1 hypothetical protein [Zunongwangia profunda]|tara:strand:+ start:5336 stop:5572 length:237 start_codon:yes stop_codon:yes gene_type:complete
MIKEKNKIMDEEQYAILRKNGVSDKEASEIAQNNEHIQKNNLTTYTDEQLIEEAKKSGIPGTDNMDRNALITALLNKK